MLSSLTTSSWKNREKCLDSGTEEGQTVALLDDTVCLSLLEFTSCQNCNVLLDDTVCLSLREFTSCQNCNVLLDDTVCLSLLEFTSCQNCNVLLDDTVCLSLREFTSCQNCNCAVHLDFVLFKPLQCLFVWEVVVNVPITSFLRG